MFLNEILLVPKETDPFNILVLQPSGFRLGGEESWPAGEHVAEDKLLTPSAGQSASVAHTNFDLLHNITKQIITNVFAQY